MATGASLGEAILDISADTKKLDSDLNSLHSRVGGALSRVQGGFKNFSAGALSTFQGLAGKIGKILSVGFAGVVAGAGLFLKKAVDAGGDFNETLSKMVVSFGELGAQKLDESLSKFGNEVGRSRVELIGMATDMGAVLKGMGFGEEQAFDFADAMTKLAVDVGSFNNVASEDVAQRFQRALTGEFESLKSLGIVINQTRLAEELRGMGITKNINQVDQATKAQAIYNLLLKSTADAQGDAARTSESWANLVVRLKGKWTDFTTKVGQRLIPFLQKFLSKGIDIFDTISSKVEGFINIVDWLYEKFKEVGFDEFFGTFEDGSNYLGTFFEKFGLGEDAAYKLGTAIGDIVLKIREFIFEQLVPFIREHAPAIRGALIGIAIAFGALAVISTIIALVTLLTNPLTILIAIAGLLGAAWAENWGGIREKVQAFWEVAQPILASTWQWLKNLWNVIITDVVPAVVELAEKVGVWLKEKFLALHTFWTESFLPKIQEIAQFFDGGLTETLKRVGDGVRDWFQKKWEDLHTLLKDKVNDVIEKLSNLLGVDLWDIINKVGDYVGGTLNGILETFGEIWAGVKRGIKGVSGLIKGIADAIQGLIDKLKKLDLSKLAAFIGESPSPLAIGLDYATREFRTFLPAMHDLVATTNKLSPILGTNQVPSGQAQNNQSFSISFGDVHVDNERRVSEIAEEIAKYVRIRR